MLDEVEKLGSVLVTHHETTNSTYFINNCALKEFKFIGIKYKWLNGRIEEDCFLKRLDRVFRNKEFKNAFKSSKVEYLIRQGSNHAPLHVICKSQQEPMIKPFKFLNL